MLKLDLDALETVWGKENEGFTGLMSRELVMELIAELRAEREGAKKMRALLQAIHNNRTVALEDISEALASQSGKELESNLFIAAVYPILVRLAIDRYGSVTNCPDNDLLKRIKEAQSFLGIPSWDEKQSMLKELS